MFVWVFFLVSVWGRGLLLRQQPHHRGRGPKPRPRRKPRQKCLGGRCCTAQRLGPGARGGGGAYDVAAGGLDALNEVSTPMYVFDGLVGEGDGGGPPAADGEAMRHVWANLPALKLMGLSSQEELRALPFPPE